MASNIHLRESEADPRPRVKIPPQATCVPVPFSYTPSDDGTDENLLILLHGLGEPSVSADLNYGTNLTS